MTVEAHASVWYGAVLRADFGAIVVREGANVHDGSVLHGGDDPATEVGPGATIGHLCVVHGCVVGAEALNRQRVDGAGRAASAGGRSSRRSLVPMSMEVPDEVLALGSPARVKGPLSAGAARWVDGNPSIYQELPPARPPLEQVE